MAEHSPRMAARTAAVRRIHGQAGIAIATIALAGSVALGVPPPPPALPPERVRVVRNRAVGPAVLRVPIRALRRLIRLCLALPAIGTTPSSRSDTPALPTVGRPRDGPHAGPP